MLRLLFSPNYKSYASQVHCFRAIFQNIDSVILAPEEEQEQQPQETVNMPSDASLVPSSQDEFTSFSESPLWSGGPTITAVGAKSAEGEVLIFNREVCTGTGKGCMALHDQGSD